MNKLVVLDNGLKVVVCENPSVRSLAAGVFVGAGSVNEEGEKSGISHLIEHMVFKGTERRSAFDIVNETDSVGAQLNAYTSKTHTCYYTVSRDIHADKCLDVLADMYFNPKFDAAELEKEKKVVLEELNESEDTPDDVCMEKLASAVYKGHALERSILGTKKTLKALSAEDLHAYKNKFYVPTDTVLSLAGNISEADAVGLAEKYFGKAPVVESPARRLEAATVKGHFAHKKKQIEQAHIAFGFPGIAYESDETFALKLLSSAFGMEMSSRLFQNVREKLGLCYSIIGYPTSYINNGSYVIYTSTSPENVELAVKAIRAEIERLLEGGITEEELAKSKEQLKTSMVLGQESTSAVMRAFGRHAVTTGELYDIDDNIRKIDEVTLKDISAVAEKVFDFERVSASFVGGEIVDIHKMMKGI